MQKKLLKEIAYARSGDKGNHANIGVIAYTTEGYQLLEKVLTEKLVHEYFYNLGVTKTTRYPMPNILGFNFVLENVLQGGGISSLRADSQGKALAQQLLQLPIEVPDGSITTY